MKGFNLARIFTFIIEMIILTYVALCLAGIDTRAFASALIGDYSEDMSEYKDGENHIVLGQINQEEPNKGLLTKNSLVDVFIHTIAEEAFLFSAICAQFYFFLMWDWERRTLSFYFVILSIGGQFSNVWLYWQLMGEEYQLSGRLFLIEVFCLYVPTTIKMLEEKGITKEQTNFLTVYVTMMIILMDWDKGIFEQFNGIILFLCPYIQIYYTYSTKKKINFSSFGWILYGSLLYSMGYSCLMFFYSKDFYAPFGILQTFVSFVVTALTFLIIFCRYGIIAMTRQLRKLLHFSLCMVYRFFNKRYDKEEVCHICLGQIYPEEEDVTVKEINELEELDCLVKLHCGHRFHFVCFALLIEKAQVCPVDLKKIKLK